MSFKIKLTCTARYGDDYNKTRQFFRLTADMYNFTDKEFFITKLYIKIADNNYIFHTMQDNGKDVLPYELKNLPMRSHEAKTIYGVILVPQGLSIPKKCIAIIETTERRLVIRVRLSVSGYFAK